MSIEAAYVKLELINQNNLKFNKDDEPKAAAATLFERACDLRDSKSCPEARKLRKRVMAKL